MAQTIYVMESANLICGDTAPPVGGFSSGKQSAGISTHLTLQELKLPGWEENYADHTPGGALVGIEIPTHFNKLEATFNLAGWDPSVMSLVGNNDPNYQRFTAYGLIRDRKTGAALQSVAVMEGRLGRANPTAFSKGNLMAHEYSIKSLISYSLYMQVDPKVPVPTTIYMWDFFTSVFWVGQNNIAADITRVLALPA